MILVKTINQLRQMLQQYRKNGQSVGFVPTMGALHAGHISLIDQARKSSEFVVASIFVNPTQFNNSEDFKKYPITLSKDLDMLERAQCDLVFIPSVEEMYPPGDPVKHYALGALETVLEGEYRPGHFQGVCRIVDKLLTAVEPDKVYLGQKDYQQCMVISKLIELKKIDTVLQVCDTVREPDGLAMSSRNMRLNDKERVQALHISKTLNTIKDSISTGKIKELITAGTHYLEEQGFKVDYIAVADAHTLEVLGQWDKKKPVVLLIAAFLNEVRLIDNLVILPPGNL